MKRFVAPALLALVAAPSVAKANVEVGALAGLHTFSDTNALGVEEREPNGPERDSLKNSALFGIRFGVFFGSTVGVELEGGLIPTEPRAQVFDVYALAYRASLVVQAR